MRNFIIIHPNSKKKSNTPNMQNDRIGIKDVP